MIKSMILGLEKEKCNFNFIEKYVSNKWKYYDVCSVEYSASNSILFDGPPPHVSGNLHMGHVFSYSHHAILIMYYRQRGINLIYGFGFDNNGIPTEKLVEKEYKISSFKTNREDFISLCEKTIDKYKPRYLDLFKRLGIIFNTEFIYDTLNVKELVHDSFNRLLEKGDVYQAKGPVLWDVAFQTAISQSELEDMEQETLMNYIRFNTAPDVKLDNELIIATTRPELLPACSAVLYNPEDERYNSLKIDCLYLPIINRRVRLIADQDVKIDKGTGLVMCCTFGDVQDIEWWKKYNLDLMIMVNKYGKIEFSKDFNRSQLFDFLELERLSIVKAREKALSILKDYIIKQDKIINSVKVSERSKKPVELIVTNQWFVKVLSYKNELIKMADRIEWYPSHMKNKFLSWVNSVSWDWCISRQRVFGISIPNSEDVFDTWFTSAITNLIVKQRCMKSDVFNDEYIPSYIRGQAHEIIRTWTFYSILLHYLHFQNIPWKKIVISGWCLAEDKSKMSKSKGNVLCPEEVLNQYGVDAVRYWAASAKLGCDFRYSEQIVKNGKRIVNKLWNSVNLFKIAVDKSSTFNLCQDAINNIKNMYDLDVWMLSKLMDVKEKYDNCFKDMDYFTAKLILEEFFMGVFCDFYLEVIKQRLYDDENKNSVGKISAQYTLYNLLKNILFLWAPILPYASEYLFQFFTQDESLLVINDKGINNKFKVIKSDIGDLLIAIIDFVRKYKSEKGLALNKDFKGIKLDDRLLSYFTENVLIDLKNVLHCSEISFNKINEENITDNGSIVFNKKQYGVFIL